MATAIGGDWVSAIFIAAEAQLSATPRAGGSLGGAGFHEI
jgi:hypothetical protein